MWMAFEPGYFKISTQSATNEEGAKELVFEKSYNAFLPVYLPTVDRFYLEICCEWLSEFIGAELGKVYDFCIAEVLGNFTEIETISTRGLQGVLRCAL